MTEVCIDFTGISPASADFVAWDTKKAAQAALKKLREQGLNTEDTVRIHPAFNRFFKFWVIARPDGLAEMALLMRPDGSWLRGRLHDGWGDPTWEHLPLLGEYPIAPSFAHVTRTVPHSGARTERYKTKSNGSQGRWVTSDDSVALCVCGWKSYTSTRGEAQSAARHHRRALGEAA